jgi:hypothetical protein
MRPQQVDLSVDFDFRDNRVVDVVYDKDRGYLADGIQVVGLGIDGAAMQSIDFEARYIKPAIAGIEHEIMFGAKKKYYTKPKSKVFGDMLVVVSLPLEKIA